MLLNAINDRRLALSTSSLGRLRLNQDSNNSNTNNSKNEEKKKQIRKNEIAYNMQHKAKRSEINEISIIFFLKVFHKTKRPNHTYSEFRHMSSATKTTATSDRGRLKRYECKWLYLPLLSLCVCVFFCAIQMTDWLTVSLSFDGPMVGTVWNAVIVLAKLQLFRFIAIYSWLYNFSHTVDWYEANV